MTSSDLSFQLSPSARFRTIDNEAVVVQQEHNKVIVLNDVSTRILELAASELTVGEMIGQLLEEFDVDEATLKTDIAQHLQELQEAAILEPSTAGGRE